MKKPILLSCLLISFLFSFTQNTHILTAYDMYFEPDTLFVEPGDTVEFISVGYHSATEIDSSDWENNNPNSNNGFYVGFGAPTSDMKFTIDNLGLFYYICVPHSSIGMKGIIVAENAVGVSESFPSNYSSISSLANGKLIIKNDKCDELTLMNISGKIMGTHSLDPMSSDKSFTINDLPKGAYLGLFKLKGKTLKVVKFILQ